MNGWTETEQALPAERECVQFIVPERQAMFYGIFHDRRFGTRIGTFDLDQVNVWRKLGDAPHAPPPRRTQRERRYWSQRPMRGSTSDYPDAQARRRTHSA